MVTLHVYYVRHGENLANLTRELSHRVVDHPLTPRGVEQAAAVAAYLAPLAPDGPVFCSPLRRARQTAAPIAERIGTRIAIDERLREVNVGILDGRCDAEAWATYTNTHRAWRAGDPDRRFPGGESARELTDRLRAAFADVAATAEGRAAVVVGHGGILRAGLPGLCPGLSPQALPADVTNCSVTELELHAEGNDGVLGELLRWGDVEHLGVAAGRTPTSR
ncbi:MAG TPA: histidine phosphatase family protein [Mycobacteriales bacterium]|nr:histidine phosphatase family protein [Mycobacteriales bacterium]